MTQDNIQIDTPQENTNQQEYSSLEEAVFDNTEGSSTVENAFTLPEDNTSGESEKAPVQGQPRVSGENQLSNDEKRFQYWQSQADKLRNENESLKRAAAQTQVAPVQAQAPVEPNQVAEAFPPPPEKPQQPRNFNRDEAHAEPNSESARYLDEVEQWRDNINEYNSLKTQYHTAVLEDKFNKMEQVRQNDIKRAQATQMQRQQQAEVSNYVTGHHGMSQQEANDFISKMSDPSSINIDNLVQLYRLGNSGAQQQATPPVPSPSFQQTQNAQQVPSPMGVMPSGQSNNDGRTIEDKMMDSMVGNFNSKNPWK
jgi:hypothetical protein